MLIETISALFDKFNGINDNPLIKGLCTVEILTSENYREHIANAERNKTDIHYPIIVLHDGNEIEFDASRFSNDKVYKRGYRSDNGNYYSKVYEPLMPYNLHYKVEIVCKKRQQLDSIILWVMQNIQARDYLKVLYNDEDNGESIYDAIVKRGNIINADEGTSSTLYRRIFEISISTLIENALIKDEILAISHKPQFYQIERKE